MFRDFVAASFSYPIAWLIFSAAFGLPLGILMALVLRGAFWRTVAISILGSVLLFYPLGVAVLAVDGNPPGHRQLRDWAVAQRLHSSRQVIEESQLYGQIIQILIEQLGVRKEQIRYDSKVFESNYLAGDSELGTDEMDSVEVIMAFEEVFGLDIPEEDAEFLSTVGDIFWYLKGRTTVGVTRGALPF